MNLRQDFKNYREYFLFLLPLFFVVHGFAQNFPLVKTSDAGFLFLKYSLIALVLLFILRWLVFRKLTKAAYYTFTILFIEFFFGAIQDFLTNNLPSTFVYKYSFLIPFFLLSLLLVFILLKRSRSGLSRTTKYLNYVFLLLIVFDLGSLAFQKKKQVNHSNNLPIVKCDSCRKPNIYLILADEYAGSKELNDLFHFNNSAFDSFLVNKGFQKIQNTRSNYNYTPYSMASLFTMDYIPNISTNSSDFNNRKVVYNKINQNNLIRILKELGYEFRNESLFDFADIPSKRHYTGFYAVGNKIISSQTFTSKVEKDLWYHMILTYKIKWAQENYLDNLRKDISEAYSNTIKQAENNDHPKFIYAHFIMPHYPYLYDENGKSLTLSEALANSEEHYLGFLQYGNQLYKKLVDEIIAKDKTHPIIIFMSDHGYTKYTDQDPSYNFMNTITIYNAKKLPDTLTNVNLFRYLLNNEFHQQLPVLKDSTIYLSE